MGVYSEDDLKNLNFGYFCKDTICGKQIFTEEDYVNRGGHCALCYIENGGCMIDSDSDDIDTDKIDLQGRKDDSGKLGYHLLPIQAVAEIVRVLDFGAKKYSSRNWESGIKYSRVYSAMQRHLTAWWDRNDTDDETGISHLGHAGCCLLFILHYELKKKLYQKFDDRPKYEEEEK